MKKIYKLLFVISVLVLFVLSGCKAQEAAPTLGESSTASQFPANAVIAEGTIRPESAAELYFLDSGMVETVNVSVGDKVNAGDLLAELSNIDQAKNQLAAAQLELLDAEQSLDALVRNGGADLAAAWNAYMDAQEVRADAERELEDLDLDAIEDDIEDLKVDIQDRQDDLDDTQEDFDKYSELDEDNTTRKNAEDDLEDAQNDYNEAVRDLEETIRERDAVIASRDSAVAAEQEAKYAYEISLEGVNADALSLAQSRVDAAAAQVAAAEEMVTYYQIVAPFDGVVMDVAIEEGQLVGPEVLAVSMADISTWIIESVDVTELDVVKLNVGQQVTFTADALPDVVMTGQVSEISQASIVLSGDVVYPVEIKVIELDPQVKWGMTVEITFEVLD